MSGDPTGDNGRFEPDRGQQRGHGDHRGASEIDISRANETLDRVRREMPYRRSLWTYRLYYIGLLSSVGSLIAGCFGNDAPMVVVPIALPLGIAGYLFGHFQLRREYRDFMAQASPEVWHSRRDRKNLWQGAIFRDAFMGRLRLAIRGSPRRPPALKLR